MADPTDDLPLFSRPALETAPVEDGHNRVNPTSSLSAAVRAWGEVLEEEGKSIHTVKAFTGDLRLLGKFIGGGMSINAIGTHDLKNFLDWMLNHRGVPCSPKTYARRVTSLKSFFRWLNDAGILTHDPAEEVPQQTVLAPLPTVLNPDEVAAALAAADAMRTGDDPDARPYTLLALLLETGIKKGECLGIHINHIDLNSADGPILFVRYGDVRKRYKERKLTLSQAWVDAYRSLLRPVRSHRQGLPLVPSPVGVPVGGHRRGGRAGEASFVRYVPLDLSAFRLPVGSGQEQDPPEDGDLQDPMARGRQEAWPVWRPNRTRRPSAGALPP